MTRVGHSVGRPEYGDRNGERKNLLHLFLGTVLELIVSIACAPVSTDRTDLD